MSDAGTDPCRREPGLPTAVRGMGQSDSRTPTWLSQPQPLLGAGVHRGWGWGPESLSYFPTKRSDRDPGGQRSKSATDSHHPTSADHGPPQPPRVSHK